MTALSAAEQAWVSSVYATAEAASAATGVNAAVILAQWGNETAYGTSNVYKNTHNFAGVTTPHTRGYVHYATNQAGLQGYIHTMMQSTYAGVRSAKTPEAQAAALAASPWAGGHYTGGAGLNLAGITSALTNIGGATASATMRTPTTGAVVANPNYKPAAESLNTSTPTGSTTAGQAASIDAVLKSAGLTSLIGWANGLARTLTAGGMSATNITATLQTKVQTQPAFQARFPGMKTRVKNGYPAISITEYLSYTAAAKAMGKAVGLPTGFMTNTEIGKLIANDVSSTELSTRLTKAYAVAANAPPETKALLTQYFGIKTGTLAAYFLTPSKATTVLHNQLTAAQIGNAGVTAGFTLPKPAATTKVGQPAPTGRAGKITATPLYLAQVGVSAATAADTFQSLSKLIPLTEGLPGTGAEKTSLTQNDLVNYGFFGTNSEELANVEQARTAPFHGGGGFVESAKGVAGAGYGNAQGTTST